MKPFILIVSFLMSSLPAIENIYDINVELVTSGQKVRLSTFANQKLLIATFSAHAPDTIQLKFWDSLQRADNTMAVIAVPVADSSQSLDARWSKRLGQFLSPRLIVTKPVMAKKVSGANQHELFRWLTNASSNGHFDSDVKEPGQLFIVNRSGILYAVLESNVPNGVLSRTLNQELIK